VEKVTYKRSRIAEMAEVPVFEITAPDGKIPNGELWAKIYSSGNQASTGYLTSFLFSHYLWTHIHSAIAQNWY
jgi:hypothetical protein